MNKYVVTSMRPSAGKTSLIIGLAKALGGKIGYMKPFGERFLYRKKRLWDYDAALITNIFNLDENPEDMSIGFHHAKLLFMLDEAATKDEDLRSRRNAWQGERPFLHRGRARHRVRQRRSPGRGFPGPVRRCESRRRRIRRRGPDPRRCRLSQAADLPRCRPPSGRHHQQGAECLGIRRNAPSEDP